jgi:hypothetical protein
MKTNKFISTVAAFIVALTVLCSSSFTAHAQSKSLPIDSASSAAQNNLKLISYTYGSVYGNSLIYTNGVQTFWRVDYDHKGVPKVSDLKQIVSTNKLVFMTSKPTNDWISAYVSYNSRDNDQLFYSGIGFQLINVDGTWQAPGNDLSNLVNNLAYYEPLYETNAMYASLRLRDANGNLLQTIRLDVIFNWENHVGRIMNMTRYLGQHGEMVIGYAQFDQYGNSTNSYEVSFALDSDKKGMQLKPAKVSLTLNPSWDGLYMDLTPPNVFMTNVTSYKHIGQSKLGGFTVTNRMAVYFRGLTTEGETARGFKLTKLEIGKDNQPVTYEFYGDAYSYGYILEPGDYQVEYLWAQLAPEQINPWWYYGVGKGKLAPTIATPTDEQIIQEMMRATPPTE